MAQDRPQPIRPLPGTSWVESQIGLKLKISTLARPVVWAGASLHMVLTIAVIGALVFLLGLAGLPLVSGLSLEQAALVGFAFSFSSTVFAAKALEERNESASLQGKIAIGILVVQDIFAVVFLTLAVDQPPSTWAIYGFMLDRTVRGELLMLLGLVLAVGIGAESFSQGGVHLGGQPLRVLSSTARSS